MKRLLVVILVLFVASGAFAQTLLNVNKYVEAFGFKNGTIDLGSNYIWTASDEEIVTFGALNIDPATAAETDTRVLTDTPLEFALLSYYSLPVRNNRPAEAAAMLPVDNPKLSEQKLGAAIYKDLVVYRFLNDAPALTRHEAMLNFIISRGNTTRAEVETFYRNGIRRLVAEVVNEEFNKVSFLLTNLAADRTYNATLIRNSQNGNYSLNYERPSVANDDKTFSAPSLEALLSGMRKNTTDFVPSDIDTVRDQAGLIPASVFASVRNNSLDLLKDILTNFYLNPNMAAYGVIRDVEVLYSDESILSRGASLIFYVIENAYDSVLISLNDILAKKVFDDYAVIRNSPRKISLPESTQRVLLDSRVIEAASKRF